MNKELFDEGIGVDDYVRGIRNYRSFVRDLMDSPTVNAAHVGRFRKASGNRSAPVIATVMTEDWCGDSACTLPLLARFFAATDVPLRILRGSDHSQLKAHYESTGTDHIPVVSVWDGEFTELVRWVEAPAAVGIKKDEWKAARPRFMELYALQKTDPAAAKEFATMYRGLLDVMAEWYQGGLWDEVTREIVEQLEK